MAKDYDPAMHTAEHILNQTMVRMFNKGRSFSNHIEKKKSKCDYHFDRMITAEETVEIELRVNDVIKSNKVAKGFSLRSKNFDKNNYASFCKIYGFFFR